MPDMATAIIEWELKGKLRSPPGGSLAAAMTSTFELDQITTACVAVAMALPDGDALVLGQARLNLRDRASRSRGLEC